MRVCWEVDHEHTYKCCKIFLYIGYFEHGDRVEFWHSFYIFNVWSSILVGIMYKLDYWSAQLLLKCYHLLASYIPVMEHLNKLLIVII
jgi:hypothetical protein